MVIAQIRFVVLDLLSVIHYHKWFVKSIKSEKWTIMYVMLLIMLGIS